MDKVAVMIMLKLQNGENVLTELQSKGESFIEVLNPHYVKSYYTEAGDLVIYLEEFFPFSNTKNYTINARDIIAFSSPNQQLIELYVKKCIKDAIVADPKDLSDDKEENVETVDEFYERVNALAERFDMDFEEGEEEPPLPYNYLPAVKTLQ